MKRVLLFIGQAGVIAFLVYALYETVARLFWADGDWMVPAAIVLFFLINSAIYQVVIGLDAAKQAELDWLRSQRPKQQANLN